MKKKSILYLYIELSCTLTHADNIWGRLSILWDKSGLPWPPRPQDRKGNKSKESFVVVPVSNNVYGTGDNKHPSYGLVKGKVLIEKTSDGARGALSMEREREREREKFYSAVQELPFYYMYHDRIT